MLARDESEALADWLKRVPRQIGIVFTDVIKSTDLLYELKTTKHNAVLRAHRSRADALTRELDGRVVDQVGDELFVVLPSATTAYRFAYELFHQTGHPLLAIRAGVHVGEVTMNGMHMSGRAVSYGHRVMEHAHKGHELWVSGAAKLALEEESLATAESIRWVATDDCYLDGVHAEGVPIVQRLWRAV
jgi:class 3 adenylate cyclase